MKLTRQNFFILLLASISLATAWQIDIILRQRIVVAPLYLIPILIITSRFKNKIIIFTTVLASISLLSYEQITENQDYLSIIFDNIGILVVTYLAIRLNMQRLRAEKLQEVSESTKKQLEILMHIVSHDIKQPITIAKLNATTLSKKTKSNNYKLIKKVIDALESITTITSDLGDAASIARGEFILHLVQIDLTQFLYDIVSEQQSTTSKHKITIVSRKKVIGKWDKERLKRVFVNLLNNAIKYSPNGGKIAIVIKKYNQNVMVGIKDMGIGMTKQEANSLFQPFVRQYKGKKKIKGTGLGLYICKSLVSAHNGKIWVSSRKGKGSTFFVELPLA